MKPSGLKKLFAAITGWLSSPLPLEESVDPSRLSESLLPISQLYGFEMSYLRARAFSEK